MDVPCLKALFTFKMSPIAQGPRQPGPSVNLFHLVQGLSHHDDALDDNVAPD